MKKLFGLAFLMLAFAFEGLSQTTFYAVNNGNWNGSLVWDTSPGGSGIPCGTCVAGTHFPGPNDDAFSNGKAITVNSAQSVRNFGITYDQAGKITISSILTINGTLAGWDDGGINAAPTVNVFSGTPLLKFTAASLGTSQFLSISGDEIIIFWNKNAPFGTVQASLVADCTIDAGDIFNGGDSELQFSSLVLNPLTSVTAHTINSGPFITGMRLSSLLSVGAFNTFNASYPIYSSTGTILLNRFTSLSVNGTLNTSSYVNANGVTFGSGSTFATQWVDGTNQTAGWWYSTNAPQGTVTINAASTIKFNGAGAQILPIRAYGSLTLDAGGSSFTKSLSSTGALTINGNLTISSNTTFNSSASTGTTILGNLVVDGTWSPNTQVHFTGSAAQTVSGSGTLSFPNGMEVNNSGSGSVLFNKTTSISNGATVTAGSFSLGASTSISGGLTLTSGTVALGSGTNTISGGIAMAAGTLGFGSSNTTVSGAGGISITAGTVTLGNAAITLTGGNLDIGASTVTAGASGTLSVSGPSTFSATSGSLTLNNLTVTSGSVTLNPAAWALTGTLTNNGTITMPSTSTVTFQGGSAQSIAAGNALTFGNIIVNKTSSTLSVDNASVKLLGLLTMTNGTLDADGGGSGVFTLNSDSGGDARVGTMSVGSKIQDNITFQRYFSNTNNRWRHFGFPISGVSYSTFSSSVGLVANGFAAYTESTPGDKDQGWNYVSGGTLSTSAGYTAYMANTGTFTVTLRGPLAQNLPTTAGAPASYAVSYFDDPAQPASEDGWNFVSNPYACAIDWTAASGWSKSAGVVGSASIWDTQSGTYKVSGSGWNGIVAAGQSFWIQTNGTSPSVTSTESVKVPAASTPTFYRVATTPPPSKLAISLRKDSLEDITYIQYNDAATAEFDNAYDAHKLKNVIYNLSTLTNDRDILAVNVMPLKAETTIIRLNIENAGPGTYVYSFDGLSSFDGLDSLVLVDKLNKTFTKVSASTKYNFTITTASNTSGSNRFELRFYYPQFPQVVTGVNKADPYVQIYPNPVSGTLNIQVGDDVLTPNGLGEVVIYSTTGVPVKRVSFDDTQTTIAIDMSETSSGFYIVNVSDGTKIIERKKIAVK